MTRRHLCVVFAHSHRPLCGAGASYPPRSATTCLCTPHLLVCPGRFARIYLLSFRLGYADTEFVSDLLILDALLSPACSVVVPVRFQRLQNHLLLVPVLSRARAAMLHIDRASFVTNTNCFVRQRRSTMAYLRVRDGLFLDANFVVRPGYVKSPCGCAALICAASPVAHLPVS